ARIPRTPTGRSRSISITTAPRVTRGSRRLCTFTCFDNLERHVPPLLGPSGAGCHSRRLKGSSRLFLVAAASLGHLPVRLTCNWPGPASFHARKRWAFARGRAG